MLSDRDATVYVKVHEAARDGVRCRHCGRRIAGPSFKYAEGSRVAVPSSDPVASWLCTWPADCIPRREHRR
jgi:hypothetical protein